MIFRLTQVCDYFHVDIRISCGKGPCYIIVNYTTVERSY